VYTVSFDQAVHHGHLTDNTQFVAVMESVMFLLCR
jgi:hypothetical protein